MSALMTTSYTLDRSGKNLTNLATGLHSTPFQHRAGHVSPNLALNPGLVYDIGTSGYDAFLCSIGYTAKQISIFVKDRHVDCESHRLSSPGDLNYPAFAVIFRDGTMDTVTYKRTVTNVGSSPSPVYDVRVFAPALVKISVTPSRLVFSETNTSLHYEITFTSKVMSAEKPEFGSIEWHGDSHVVKSPIAFTWGNSTTSLISSQ
ncbi:subtilisin-like protease SBT1.4 [Papaver somniferum]|uniref:subtilisin-like protease SBT1.4 n=1 Tax=Papaver somniferum TaxID=3469 RepID=UPI000E6FC1EC|nr:subtilisin-like protease SBT1.4 [Papaver somniferum]